MLVLMKYIFYNMLDYYNSKVTVNIDGLVVSEALMIIIEICLINAQFCTIGNITRQKQIF